MMIESGIKATTEFKKLGQSPWGMAMCLVWQSVLLGNGLAVFKNKYPGRQTP